MEIAIMVEGQDGINWQRWERLAKTVEEAGFVGLYRSDHFTNPNPPDHDSLDAWIALSWLASHTREIEFGPLVSPVSFRHPVWLARMAGAIDDLSGGRLTLGVGAGWQIREHESFGFDLLGISERFDRLEEGLQVITALLRSEELVSFDGKYYQLHDAQLLPRPLRRSALPILIGGNGENRTLPLAAHYADEWNGVFISASRFAELNQRLDALLAERNRPVESVRRSLMTGLFFGADDPGLQRKLVARNVTAEKIRERGMVVGTPSAVQDQLAELAAAGVQRIMLNWFDLDDLEGLQALARAVL
ncbi:MAG: TIGR03560 family F420-dependent LLM class oxidoreductase [Chloroflexi bacterium]|nr:TIGR03560 family F420-dependent LLM class oxidoreductase [Chloroflexota bacterium]